LNPNHSLTVAGALIASLLISLSKPWYVENVQDSVSIASMKHDLQGAFSGVSRVQPSGFAL